MGPKALQYHMKSADDINALSTGPKRKAWIRVCTDDEIAEGRAKRLDLDKENEQVAVFRHRDSLYALDNRCSHMGGPLCDGDIEDLSTIRANPRDWEGGQATDGVVKCPRHGMCFNIRTGVNIDGSAKGQRVYPVRVTSGGDVEVELDVLET